MMRSSEALQLDVHPSLEFPLSIRREVLSVCSNDTTGKGFVWVDLQGNAGGSDGCPLEKAMAQQDGAELSVYLICFGPRLSPLSESKWSSVMKDVRHVHVPNTVEDISDGCFRGCWSLSRVVFCEGASVKRMGVEAFSGCDFTEIHIPKSVEQICDRCFSCCMRLRRITFREDSSLKRIGKAAFSRVVGGACPLTEIYIPDSVEELCDDCFFQCQNLSRIIFGPQSSLRRLGNSVFFGLYHNCAPQLTEIRIPDRVETIGRDCFYCCPLSQVVFGECPSLKVIGPAAFSGDSDYGCELGNIRIPDSVERLCHDCFSGCHFLSCVSFGDASALRRIGSHAFCNCALKEIRIPDTVIRLGSRCFFRCQLERITFGASSSLKRICTECFRASHLVEFSIPKSLELLEGGAFAQCPLSYGVTCVENPHFSILDPLLLSSLNALSVCCPVVGDLSEVVIPEDVKSIGKYCFSAYEHLSSVKFSAMSTLKRISKGAFMGCRVTEVLIPSSVVYIGRECFSCCETLVRVTFSEPSKLKRIGKGAFNRCKCLEEIHIPDGVQDLPDECFSGCCALKRVTFGESSSLRRIGVKVFSYDGWWGCSLIEIHIPDSVEEICDCCFSGCQSSLRVTFGESSALKRVHSKAFPESVLKRISLPPAAVSFTS